MIHVTSDEQFKSAIAAADKFTIASFSAPWCGSCKMIKSKVEKLGEELADKSSLLKLDAEELEELFEELEVESFPHFRVYKNGELLGEYTGAKFEKVEEFVRGIVA
ncbi:hypothetical protein ATCC90586_008059 [Pythium insidiosum]|nr:hypothetical protein ATCC90586_008059 [Pythium insidiosum]